MSRVWFVTGSSRGLGRQWVTEALRCGDRVVATARDVGDLAYLGDHVAAGTAVTARCDVTDPESVTSAIETGFRELGRIDVVVNAAGVGMFAPLEDSPLEDVRRLLDVNVLGSWAVVQAMLRRTSVTTPWTLLQVSSIAGMRGFADMSAYAASKWAVEGMVESLRDELADRPVRVHLVEPGPYLTDWIGSSAFRPPRSDRYPGEDETRRRHWPRMVPEQPQAAASALTELLALDPAGLRVTVGASAAACWAQAQADRAVPDAVCVTPAEPVAVGPDAARVPAEASHGG